VAALIEKWASEESPPGVGHRRCVSGVGKHCFGINPRSYDGHCVGLKVSRNFFGEEEISDVSLGTFYVFDKEPTGQPRPAQHLRLARCGGGYGRGCVRPGACGGGCGGCGGCGGGNTNGAAVAVLTAIHNRKRMLHRAAGVPYDR